MITISLSKANTELLEQGCGLLDVSVWDACHWPNMQTHLKWEEKGWMGGRVGKPALWSWHLIPTSCRLSEQLQGRTLLLNCNDQFETRQESLNRTDWFHLSKLINQ